MNRLLGAAVGLVADRLVGEPPAAVPHPVARFGSVMGVVERAVYAPRAARGAVYVAAGLGLGLLAGRSVRSTATATWIATGGSALADAARGVQDALVADDLDEARRRLPALVGRDPSSLDAGEIARAVVESVAENTVDAVVAPVLWGAALGAPGVLVHRAVDTMDSMVGYRSERYAAFGSPAARLDDAAAWVPARVTALLVAAVRPARAADVWRTVRRDARAHPSPNAGVAEAAFAAALELRLGGTNRYGDRVEERALLGDGKPPEAADIGRAVRLAADCGTLLAALLAVAGLVRRGRRRGRRRPAVLRIGDELTVTGRAP